MTFTNLLPWFSILGIGILLFFQWKQRQNIRGTDVSILQKELAEKSKELTEVKKELEKEKEGKSTLSGQNKELYAQVTNLKAEKNSLIKENEKLQTQVTKTEAGREQKEKEYSQALQKLDEAKKSLEEERKRVIREDEERKKQELEERDRMWNEHEHVVVSQLTDLCAKPQLKFTTYDNTNLPDDFDGSIKPDFLIDFLGQYIIFDAKISCSKCSLEMNKIEMEKNGIKVRAVECPRCHERIIHPEDKQNLEHFKGLKGKTYNVKLRIVGNSHTVSIPKEIVDFMEEMNKFNGVHNRMRKHFEEMDNMVRLCFEDMGKISFIVMIFFYWVFTH